MLNNKIPENRYIIILPLENKLNIPKNWNKLSVAKKHFVLRFLFNFLFQVASTTVHLP